MAPTWQLSVLSVEEMLVRLILNDFCTNHGVMLSNQPLEVLLQSLHVNVEDSHKERGGDIQSGGKSVQEMVLER